MNGRGQESLDAYFDRRNLRWLQRLYLDPKDDFPPPRASMSCSTAMAGGFKALDLAQEHFSSDLPEQHPLAKIDSRMTREALLSSTAIVRHLNRFGANSAKSFNVLRRCTTVAGGLLAFRRVLSISFFRVFDQRSGPL
jgi:hypothetical protein